MNGKIALTVFILSLLALLPTGCASTNSETEGKKEGITTEKVAKQTVKMAIRRSPIAILKAVK